MGSTCYLWNSEKGIIHEIETDRPICTLGWIHDGSALSFVNDQGIVQIFDINHAKIQRKMTANDSFVRTLSMAWNKQLLACGSQDSLIRTFDIRVKKPIQNLINPSKTEVTCLRWNIDGSMFATGSIDGQIGIISKDGGGRIINSIHNAHNSEIKAMSWCPWQNGLLATGGSGPNDHFLKLWSCSSSDNNDSVSPSSFASHSKGHIYQVWNQDLGSEITNLLWSKPISHSNYSFNSPSLSCHSSGNDQNYRDLIVSHGDQISFYALNNWSRLSQRRGAIERAHLTSNNHESDSSFNHCTRETNGKILSMALNPNGTTLCTIGSDENIKLWKCYKNNSDYKGPLLSELVPTRANRNHSNPATSTNNFNMNHVRKH